MAGYYDFVLVLIPLVFAGVTAILAGLGVGVTAAVPLASVSVLPVIGHAMFVRAPGAAATDSYDTSASTGAGVQAAD
jgi:hypothetical protein